MVTYLLTTTSLRTKDVGVTVVLLGEERWVLEREGGRVKIQTRRSASLLLDSAKPEFVEGTSF